MSFITYFQYFQCHSFDTNCVSVQHQDQLDDIRQVPITLYNQDVRSNMGL